MTTNVMTQKVAQPVTHKSASLLDLFGLTDAAAASVVLNVRVNSSPLVPALNSAYQFQEDHVRRLLLWFGGVACRNLLISGPTGCGKSSLLEQFLSRMGHELYRVGCHGKMEFGELTGQTVILPDGSTKFIHGPLPRAMKTGATLLLDEVNFLHPNVVGALNTVLDGGTLLIPETGELIQPHPDFRIAATGNSVDRGDDAALYAGTQRMNLAMKQRFLTLKADYLNVIDEAAMLNRSVPALPGKVVEIMAYVADDIRTAFKNGAIESVISSRISVRWANIMAARLNRLIAKPEEEMQFALQFCLTDGLNSVDATAICLALKKRAAGLTLSAEKVSANGPVANASESGDVEMADLTLCINPDHEGTGNMAFMASILDRNGKFGTKIKGMLTAELRIGKAVRANHELIKSELSEKIISDGYTIVGTHSVSKAESEDTLNLILKWLNHGIMYEGNVEVLVGVEKLSKFLNDIVSKMGLNTKVLYD